MLTRPHVIAGSVASICGTDNRVCHVFAVVIFSLTATFSVPEFLLQRQHIQIEQINCIGKESSCLEDVEAGLIQSAQNVYTEYPIHDAISGKLGFCPRAEKAAARPSCRDERLVPQRNHRLARGAAAGSI